MVRVSPGPPKITAWWATSPGRRTLWIVTPSTAPGPAARPFHCLPLCRCAVEGLRTPLRHLARRGDGGARRRVHLALVVHLYQLNVVEEASGGLRQVGHHDRAEGEVGRGHGTELSLPALPVQLVQERLRKAGGANHEPRPRLQRLAGHDGRVLRVREVHHAVRAGARG